HATCDYKLSDAGFEPFLLSLNLVHPVSRQPLPAYLKDELVQVWFRHYASPDREAQWERERDKLQDALAEYWRNARDGKRQPEWPAVPLLEGQSYDDFLESNRASMRPTVCSVT